MQGIYVLADQKGIGKTTYLQSMVEDHPNRFTGLLSPIYNGLRHFYFISRQQYIQLECSDLNETPLNLTQVGCYKFYASAFKEASTYLEDSAKIKNRILIIDEIGHLELKEQGLHSAVNKLTQKNDLNATYLLVIRQNLLEEVIDFYNLSPIKIISLKDLSNRGSIYKKLLNKINPGM